jgi:hypothetical protein
MKVTFRRDVRTGNWYPAYWDLLLKPYHPGWLPLLPQPLMPIGIAVKQKHWQKYLVNENSGNQNQKHMVPGGKRVARTV